MTTIDDEITAPEFPMPQSCPFAMPAEHDRLREQAPVVPVSLPTGERAWMVTRHAETQQLLADPRISRDPSSPGYPVISPSGHDGEPARPGVFVSMDPPEHDTYRKMLVSEFTVRKVTAMRPGIQQVVDGSLDDLVGQVGTRDLVEHFGLAVPSLVTCQLLGVPYADHEYFESRARAMLRADADPEGAATARNDIYTYLDDRVTRSERDPGDDLIGRLVTERISTGQLGHDAATGMATMLLLAGHETTSNMIPLGTVTLLEHPEQLAELRADPSLWPGAVEELLRFHSIVGAGPTARVAIDDIDIGEQHIRRGDGVFLPLSAANRDSRAFEDPDTFDIHRNARHHVAFSYGIHQCLGQNLARAEMEIALRTLFERIPTLRLADGLAVTDLPFKYGRPVFGLHALPVQW